jgi:hypothetical protein
MSTCGCGNRNQTRKEIIRDVVMHERKNPGALPKQGVGVFFVPRPDKGYLAFEKIIIVDVSYGETNFRARHCTGFKWFTYEYLSERHRLTGRDAIKAYFSRTCEAGPCDPDNGDDDCQGDDDDDVCFCVPEGVTGSCGG